MDTLKSLRKNERILEISGVVNDKSKAAYVTVELERREKDTILIFTRHSEDIVDIVLKEVDIEDSGYIFFASELTIDPINNFMVPKHRLATQEELEGLAMLKIPFDKLPILRMLDPIRRWHNFPKNSVVAIERDDDDIYFRRVI
jgi:DNA-directed RNA polymerase subunit H (RpoH/RPB5)